MNEASKSEPWVSIEDVAAHLGVRRDSIYRWIDHRGLPATKIGKLWKMKLSEVDRWMRERTERKHRPERTPEAAAPPSGPSEHGRTSLGAAPGEARTELDKLSSPLVLVLDDDPVVRDTLEDFFTDEGYRVLLAQDGEDALAMLAQAQEKPSLIVLDLKMPRLDGWKFRERQCADPDLLGIPVIIVTAAHNPKLEGVKILKKPLHLDQLARAIAELAGGGAHDERIFNAARMQSTTAGRHK